MAMLTEHFEGGDLPDSADPCKYGARLCREEIVLELSCDGAAGYVCEVTLEELLEIYKHAFMMEHGFIRD